MSDQRALSVRGLTKTYGRRGRALADCSFDLPKGRVAALVGRNGAGKTTLLNLAAGLLAPTEGTVLTTGRVSLVAQDRPLYRSFTVAEMLMAGEQLNSRWNRDRAVRWLTAFEVPLNQVCARLSGGQRSQVSLALALAAEPDLLLLDEPLSDLDPVARREVSKRLLAEAMDTEMTVLMSTHVVSELVGFADYLVVLGKGRPQLTGEVDELLATHQVLLGPRSETPPVPGTVVEARHNENQSTFLLRADQGQRPGGPWVVRPVSLEDLVVAHLEAAA